MTRTSPADFNALFLRISIVVQCIFDMRLELLVDSTIVWALSAGVIMRMKFRFEATRRVFVPDISLAFARGDELSKPKL